MDLKSVTADSALATHLNFDKSIFRDCAIEPANGGTRITVNTTPVTRFAVVPLSKPNRLLVTFTPEGGAPPEQGAVGVQTPITTDNSPPEADSGAGL
jgi:hypothetical protein